ncbi:site-specific integrase [Pseudomonas aeruginosa]|uniref:site-specific integrase n=1 Tax=Pseudomonas aeruginosa TaxID=287 RepID=UPI0034E0918B
MKSSTPALLDAPSPPSGEVRSGADVDDLVARYRQSGKSANTERTYKAHINHYRYEWGGFLPAGEDAVCRYLATYAQSLKVSTLRQRLSALSKWHKQQGFFDPTSSSTVKQTMKGIAKEHQDRPKQAYPLTFRHLLAICDQLEAEKMAAIQAGEQGAILRTHRDLALVLVGFWQGFRSDELSRVAVENVKASRTDGISIFLSHSKTDREASGRIYEMHALRAYCPASAYIDWLQASGITSGLVFRSINRWGHLGATGIHKQSIGHIINRVANDLFPDEPHFSTHSLRHGFADWAVRKGWDMTMLMEHVGWRSIENAKRYMPKRKDFGSLALDQQALPTGSDLSSAGNGKTLLSRFQSLPDSD